MATREDNVFSGEEKSELLKLRAVRAATSKVCVGAVTLAISCPLFSLLWRQCVHVCVYVCLSVCLVVFHADLIILLNANSLCLSVLLSLLF